MRKIEVTQGFRFVQIDRKQNTESETGGKRGQVTSGFGNSH